jgi:hypothetical protein
VEWLDFDKDGKKYLTKRYSVTRIGQDIYILHGEDKNVVRSMNNPEKCTLSTNGIIFSSRSG